MSLNKINSLNKPATELQTTDTHTSFAGIRRSGSPKLSTTAQSVIKEHTSPEARRKTQTSSPIGTQLQTTDTHTSFAGIRRSSSPRLSTTAQSVIKEHTPPEAKRKTQTSSPIAPHKETSLPKRADTSKSSRFPIDDSIAFTATDKTSRAQIADSFYDDALKTAPQFNDYDDTYPTPPDFGSYHDTPSNSAFDRFYGHSSTPDFSVDYDSVNRENNSYYSYGADDAFPPLPDFVKDHYSAVSGGSNSFGVDLDSDGDSGYGTDENRNRVAERRPENYQLDSQGSRKTNISRADFSHHEEDTPVFKTLENLGISTWDQEGTHRQTAETTTGSKRTSIESQKTKRPSAFNKLQTVFKKSSDGIKKFASNLVKSKNNLIIETTYRDKERIQGTQRDLEILVGTMKQKTRQADYIAKRYESVLEKNPPKAPKAFEAHKAQLFSCMQEIIASADLSATLSDDEHIILNAYEKIGSARLGHEDVVGIQNILQRTVLQARISVVHDKLNTGKQKTETRRTPRETQNFGKLSQDLSFSVRAGVLAELQELLHSHTGLAVPVPPDKRNKQRYDNIAKHSKFEIPLMNSHDFKALGMSFVAAPTTPPKNSALLNRQPQGSLRFNLCIPKVFGQPRSKNNQLSFSLIPLHKSAHKIETIKLKMENLNSLLLNERVAHTVSHTGGGELKTAKQQRKNDKIAKKEQSLRKSKIAKLERSLAKLSGQLQKENMELIKKTNKIANAVGDVVIKGIKKSGHKEALGLPFTEKSRLFKKTSNDRVNAHQKAALNYLYKVAESSMRGSSIDM